jgi:hypothetical protein
VSNKKEKPSNPDLTPDIYVKVRPSNPNFIFSFLFLFFCVFLFIFNFFYSITGLCSIGMEKKEEERNKNKRE